MPEVEQIKVRDLISRPEPIVVKKDVSLKEAAKLMADERIGFLVVVADEDERKVIGVLSERDIINAFGYGKDEVKVKDIMKTSVVHVYIDDPISKAAKLMKEHNIRHLVVLDRDNKLTGVLSIKDLTYKEGALFSLIF